MAEIIHRLRMKASLPEVWSAFITRAGLAGLSGKVERARRDPSRDSVADFRFGDETRTGKMHVVDVEDGAHLVWRFVAGPPDWVGTDVTVDLAADGDATVVRLQHGNWKETTDFMGHCSTRWASLLFGLKSSLETPEAEDLYL